MTEGFSKKGHSEESFNEYRNFWWNTDFIDLMARRWSLKDCKSLLDVGSGLCHWSLLLSDYLAKGAEVEGMDSDRKWSVLTPDLKEKFARRGANIKLTMGSAIDWPYKANSFDVVTCQTLLIHLDNPKAAVKEMMRVVKPGGLVIAVEPSNIAFSILADSATDLMNIDRRLKLVEHNMIYELGKMKQGRGYNSLGDNISQYYVEEGLEDISVYQSDKASPIFPPYGSPEQKALIGGICEWFDKKEGVYDRDDYYEAYKAAGSHYLEKFEEHWELKVQAHVEMMKLIHEKRYFSNGGCLMYLVSGRKLSR